MMGKIDVDATPENIDTVTDFVDGVLEDLNCPGKALTQINIAIDELFGNIAHYAYYPETGPVTVCVDADGDPISVLISFIDQGRPFDPLQQKNPDTKLSVKDRPAGGMGIFLARQIMDEVTYEYKNGKNILKIRKEF